jgi:4-amino-4-deoxy-L-arabinose transferase-like glycosyltransferase
MAHDAHVAETGIVERASPHVLAETDAQSPARERWVDRLHPLLGATLVFAVAMLAFVPGIGQREIWTRDEARTALVVREMLASNDWSIARLPGRVHGKKPPLYHWLTAVASRRGLDETTLRLPAAVAASGTAVVVYLLGAQLIAPAVGLIAAAVLVASPGFFEWARVGRMETLLVFCLALSLWGLARWLRWGGYRNGLLFGIGLGLAMLTKGPAGLLALVIAVLAVVTCRSRPGQLRKLAPGLALAGALPLAWLGLAALMAPDFGEYAGGMRATISGELTRRSGQSSSGIMALAIGFLPWTLLLPGALFLAARRRPADTLVVVSLWWLTVVIVVFLFLVSPRAAYFEPAFPPLALLAAWGWWTARGRVRRALVVPLGLGVIAVAATGLVMSVWPTIEIHHVIVHLPLSVMIAASGLLVGVGLVSAPLERRGASVAAIVTLAVGVMAALVVFELGVRVPFDNKLYSVRAAAARLEPHVPPGATVAYLDVHRVTAIAVYLRRPLTQLPALRPGDTRVPPLPEYVLMTADLFEHLAGPWSLERVDKVGIHHMNYILARHRVRAASTAAFDTSSRLTDDAPAHGT